MNQMLENLTKLSVEANQRHLKYLRQRVRDQIKVCKLEEGDVFEKAFRRNELEARIRQYKAFKIYV